MDDAPVTPGAGDVEGRGVQYNVIAAFLRLSRCRSEFLVGQALADAYPTDEAWNVFLNDPETQEQFQALADVAEDIRVGLHASYAADPEAVQRVVEQHYERGLESVMLVAESLVIDPQELLNVLVND